MSVMRTIETEACIEEGSAWLAAREERFAHALDLTGLPPLRRREEGFRALLGAIVSQQLSVAAADSIWNRMASSGLTEPPAICSADDAELRGCGLSKQKVRYVRALADSGTDFEALRAVSDEEVVRELTRIAGIGRWTAEIYAMFALGRADVFAAGDLALKEATRLLFGMPDRPTERQLAEQARRWSPWRAVAARILWSYYRLAKDREGIRA